MKFPPLYECSKCGAPVRVTPQEEGDPIIDRTCRHDFAPIWANRKVTLRGKGTLESMSAMQRGAIRLKLTLRQFLSALTGRSV